MENDVVLKIMNMKAVIYIYSLYIYTCIITPGGNVRKCLSIHSIKSLKIFSCNNFNIVNVSKNTHSIDEEFN